ncbi:hypothetical protein [Clostridium rectalis]|uniref:hypothetical protein n=1 Tax=Clostridium rectalis TaxID=2040295 RepID=UPI0013DE0318|nr:hypothetical protein [Clostridium rectalis]
MDENLLKLLENISYSLKDIDKKLSKMEEENQGEDSYLINNKNYSNNIFSNSIDIEDVL